MKAITPLEDHPDVLWVSRDLKKDKEFEAEYKVDSTSIKALLNFLNYRAYALKKKFIFIEDAHLLSVIVSNKLLKVLEELPEAFCLFLLAPKEESLLPTVESRAIKVLLPHSSEIPSLISAPSFTTPQEAVLELKKADDPLLMEKMFIEERLEKILKNAQYHECHDALENLKLHNVSESFNNSKAPRLSPFFN